MKGNGSGDYLVDRDKDMKCFDRLPLRIREALRHAVFDIGAPQVRSAHNRLGVTKTVAEVRRIDREHLEQTQAAAWGEGHP